MEKPDGTRPARTTGGLSPHNRDKDLPMKYFVCTVGNLGQGSVQASILRECLTNNIYELHRDARWPTPLGHIQKGDRLLLKTWCHIVAWGIARGSVRIEAEDYNNGWNRIVEVEKWNQFDAEVPTSGVYHYGIQGATVSGAGQFAVVKEVESSWAEGKLKMFGDRVAPTCGVSNEVTCQNNQLLRDIFKMPLEIPSYQRCFCWRKENVMDLLETLRLRMDAQKETHLGTIILKREGGRLSIVDGQQRLLTLTILAFCLKNAKGVKNELPLLKRPFNGTSNEAKAAQQHIYWAKDTVEQWLKTNAFGEAATAPESSVERWLKTNAFDTLLDQVQFCIITLPESASEDLAYIFFNAVNSSGKKLSDYDLLKAHHLRFITDEATARVMAQRWDATDAKGDGDTLNILYRLRTWSRYADPTVDVQNGHRLFKHFSAKASTINGIFFPPLAIRFNSAIQGGAPFFYYAERHQMLWNELNETGACSSLYRCLSGHSGNVLRDTIRALLFLYYCKFGRGYLEDALFCIADCLSVLRNDDRVGRTTFRAGVIKACLLSLDTALEPGQFFDWCLSPERQYIPKNESSTTKCRYWNALASLYGEISKHPPVVLKEHIKKRAEALTPSLPPKGNKKEDQP